MQTNHARMHGRTHSRTPTTVAVRPPNHDGVMVGRTLSDAGETMADRRLIEINRRTGHTISQRFWKFLVYKKIARPNWDANPWQDVLSDDTNS